MLGFLVESFFGALSVFSINPPALMAAHMGVALMSFGALIALMATLSHMKKSPEKQEATIPIHLKRGSWFIFTYLYLLIYVGAYVSSTGAGGAFRGMLLPLETFAEAGRFLLIDIAHRSLAAGLVVLVLRLAILSFRFRCQRRDYFIGSLAAVILVMPQAMSGMYMVAA